MEAVGSAWINLLVEVVDMELVEEYFATALGCESDIHDGMEGLEVSDRDHNDEELRYFPGMDRNILLKLRSFSRLQPWSVSQLLHLLPVLDPVSHLVPLRLLWMVMKEKHFGFALSPLLA